MVATTTFRLPFLYLSTFGSRGIVEGFGIAFLLVFRMCLALSFLLGLQIECVVSLMHNKCMNIGTLDCPYFDELIFLMH